MGHNDHGPERDDYDGSDTLDVRTPGVRRARPGRRRGRRRAGRAELVEEFGSDDPAATFAPHREGFREVIVGRLVEDEDALDSEHDDVTAHDSGEDDDLTAEEAALHYVDPENDPIPE